jgi:menaquinone-dependent protoporphyrinogen IX oxidase
MRALVVYSSKGRMAPLAKGLGRGLESVGFAVQLQEGGSSSGILPMGQYDLVCIGSPVLGLLGGAIADDIEALLKRATRLEGKASVAFVRPRLVGNTRALGKLMAAMERQGAVVQDFAAVPSPGDAYRLGCRLANVVRR